MPIAYDSELTPIDVEKAFVGNVVSVNYLTERLLEEVERHRPVQDLCQPNCRGCEQLYRLYFSLLKHLVALGQAVETTEALASRTRSSFENALRRAFPRETREMETNPRVPRHLEDYDPESLGEALVTFANHLGESRYAAGMEYSKNQVASLQDECTALGRGLAEAKQSAIDVTTVRTLMGSALLGIPDPLVDQLLAGKLTLFTFLRELAGPGGTRLELDGTAIEVRVLGKGEGRASSGEGRASSHSRDSAEGTLRTQGGGDAVGPDAVGPDAQAPSIPGVVEAGAALRGEVRGHPGEMADTEFQDAGGINLSAPRAHESLEGIFAPNAEAGASSRAMAPEDLRKHLAACMTDGALFTLARLKQAEGGLGVDLGRGLRELVEGGMIEVVRTMDGDALILPTDAFRTVVDSVDGEPRSAHQLWASMRHFLRSAELKRAVAEALCPFLERDYDLLRFDLDKSGGAVWLSLSVPPSHGPHTGLLGCIVSPGPYRLPSLPPYCDAVWLTGSQENLKTAPSVPQGPAVYYGPAERSRSDEVWVAVRPVEGVQMR